VYEFQRELDTKEDAEARRVAEENNMVYAPELTASDSPTTVTANRPHVASVFWKVPAQNL
jgi:hypothetical protein